ncbi:8-amino-3,8-dideoxy-manno-octulosonate cytidylyltransferase [Abditibacteriota bacterium]|nr:8-amino-3,8-dideoxy-manno-octulosonate cytidylyltransferase [Abditibacteriota bacterium]
MNDAKIIIPARYASSRFPGKPLAELEGQTVIARVVRAALQSRASRPIYVATDDSRIATEVESQFSPTEAQVVMTSEKCHTGTDRLAEAIQTLALPLGVRQIVVNVQGDEPFLDPTHVNALLNLMDEQSDLQMATLATPLLSETQFLDPNTVKAVVSQRQRALYFSRAPIPFDREKTGTVQPLRHLGIYAYEARWLLQMAALPPSPLEESEKLEQLRALDAGIAIGVAIVENVVPIAIDTPEDLERARLYLRAAA